MAEKITTNEQNERYEQAVGKITLFLEKHIYKILFLLIFISFIDKSFFNMEFPDPDSYMRAIRIHNWLESPSFFEQPIKQSNYPFGEISHWTRPMDILWLIAALPFFCFMDIKAALFAGGHLLSPFFCLLSVWLLTYGLKRIFNIWLVLTGCLIFLANPEFQAYYAPDYPDHHALMMTLSLAAVAQTLCWLKTPLTKYLNRLGIILALAVMTSAEGMLLTAIFVFPFILQYLRAKSSLAPVIRILGYFAFFLTLFWLLNPPYEGWLYPDNGRISILFVTCGWLIFFGTSAIDKCSLSSTIGKILGFTAVGITVPTLLYFLFGSTIFTPPIDGELKRIWAYRILEMQSFEEFSLTKQLKYYTTATVALFLNLALLKNKSYRQILQLNLCWGIPLFALSLYAGRFTAYQVVFALIPYLALIAVLYEKSPYAEKKSEHFPTDIWLALLSVFLLEQLANLPNFLCSENKEKLTVSSAAPLQQNIKAIGGTLVTDVFFSPQYVWECAVNTVGTAYHRNREGLLDNHNILYAEDDSKLFALLKKHQVSQILLFAGYDETYYSLAPEHQNKLYYRLIKRQNIPPFLKEISGEAETTRHYRVKYDVDFKGVKLETAQ